jgi:hypothetical protein
MAHSNAVADAWNAEELGPTSARVDPFLDKAFKIAHPDMTWDEIGKAGGDADHRFIEFSAGYAGSE